MAALLVSALWGGNLVALKLGLSAFPPFWSAFWRMLLGVVAVAAWARYCHLSLRLRSGERRALVALGLVFAVQIALLNLGTNWTSPAYAVVLINAHPIFANLIGHFVVTEERLTRLRILGLALAFGGISYVVLGRPVAALAARPLLGNFLLVVSAFLVGLRTVYMRWLIQSIEPERALLWQMLISLPFFLGLAAGIEPLTVGPLTAAPVAALLYQGIPVAGGCFIIWTLLLRRHSAGSLSMFAFTVPFFGIFFSALIFSEPVTGRVLLGAVLVTAGIGIVTRRPASR